MNRVQDSIDLVRKHFAGLTQDQLDATDAHLALDAGEHFDMQRLQSQEHAAGRLSTEEALVIYASLGESCSSHNGGWSDGVDTATKYAVTLVVEKLLGARLGVAA